MLSIQLTKSYVALGLVQLVPRASRVAEVVAAWGQPSRVLPLYFKEIFQHTLYLYDDLGIRFWAKDEVITEWQLVLEPGVAEVFPEQAYYGPLTWRGQLLPLPLPGSLFATSQLPDFALNTDRQQYGLTTYQSVGLPLTYTVTLGRQTGNVATISVS